MKHSSASILLCLAALSLSACQQTPNETADNAANQAPAAPAPVDPIARGKYMTVAMGCNDCHTPMKFGPSGPEPDMSRMLSGHPETLVMPPPPVDPKSPWFLVTNMTAFAGPWGISYAYNLTPDSLTGMGIWTEDMFIKAMRTGRHMGASRPILPPMPWQSVSTLTDEDIKAMFAYLKSVPPIRNKVPEPVIAGPPAPPAEGSH